MWSAVALAAFSLALPSPVPPDEGAWRRIKAVDGVTLYCAAGDRAPWGMGAGEIAAPLERVIAHLIDFASLSRFLPRLAELRVLSRGTAEALVYFRFDLPWPISDRDWTVRYRWQRQGDHFVMIWSDANDRGPPPGKAVRVAPVRGRWELSSTPTGTTWARYQFLAELGGSLPQSVVDQTAWKQPLETFRGVRRAVQGR